MTTIYTHEAPKRIWADGNAAADRIEELEAHCKHLRLEAAHAIEWLKRLADDLNAAEGREARLKDKLAKAVEALRNIADPISLAQGNVNAEIAHATLAELAGDTDET